MTFYSQEICGQVLYGLNAPSEDIQAARKCFSDCPELVQALTCPTVSKEDKYKVIDKLFAQSLRNFLKVMIDFGHIGEMDGIFTAYDECVLKAQKTIKAQLYFVTKPDENMIKNLKEMLKTKYGVSDVVVELKQDESLIGGYRLTVGDIEYDKSIQGTVKMLENILTRR